MAFDVIDHGIGCVLVVFGFSQVQQFAGARQSVAQVADAVDGLVEKRSLAAQGLRTVRVVPDLGIAQFTFDLLQSLALGIVVKETPSAHPADR
jgi:hypothetical protein